LTQHLRQLNIAAKNEVGRVIATQATGQVDPNVGHQRTKMVRRILGSSLT